MPQGKRWTLAEDTCLAKAYLAATQMSHSPLFQIRHLFETHNLSDGGPQLLRSEEVRACVAIIKYNTPGTAVVTRRLQSKMQRGNDSL